MCARAVQQQLQSQHSCSTRVYKQAGAANLAWRCGVRHHQLCRQQIVLLYAAQLSCARARDWQHSGNLHLTLFLDHSCAAAFRSPC